MNDDVRRALATVARYQSAIEVAQYFHVGDGPYALVAVFANGRRLVKAVGFDTVADAEVFAAYAEHASPPQREVLAQQLAAAGMKLDPTPWERFEVVRLERAVASGDLERLRSALEGDGRG